MPEHCPRCEAVVLPGDGSALVFCQACGLPQLRVPDDVVPDPYHRAETAYALLAANRGRALDWPFALRLSAIAAMVGLIPCALLPGAVVSGGAGALGIFLLPLLTISVAAAYLRRRPQRPITPGAGSRMGAVTALFLTAGLTLSSAIAGFVLRYRYHSHAVEQNLNTVMQNSEAQMRLNNLGPGAEPILLAMRTPEWHAGTFLAMEFLMALLLLAAGAAFGALAGAMLGARQKRSQVQ